MMKYLKKIFANSIQLADLPVFIRKIIDPDTYKREIFIIQSSYEIKKDGKVLDAGAGECQYKKYFQEQYYVGTDLGIGEKNWDYSNLDVLSNLEQLPFKNDTFDSILCIQVLEHVKEPDLVIKEFYRVLKQHGYLYLSVPQGWCVHQAPFDYYRYTNYGITYLLEKANFNVEFIIPTTGYFGYLANRLLFFPKYLFWTIKKRSFRIILFPLEFFSYIIFVFVLAPLLNLIDFIDKNKDFTLHYLVKAKK